MLEITIPGFKNENKSIKDLVFSLLAEGVPKTLTQLHKEIRRIYCVSVSFQAVMKAVNALVEKKVLQREKMLYSIDREWIFESRNFLDRLYRIYFNVQEPIKKIELGKEIVVYTLNNLFELDRLWNDLLTNWAKNEQHDKRNAWKGRHCWWLIPRLQEEDILHDLFTKCEIKTYNLIFENTLLDKAALNYYRNKHENVKINKKLLIEKDTHISAFGDFLLKFEIPKNISKRLEYIYKTTTKIESLNLKEVLDIFKENQSIEVTVIKDKMLADKIKEEIIDKSK
jgi:hypothetical protein